MDAETVESWATAAVAIATTLAIVAGGMWAFWRYVLPRPFEPTWEALVGDCWARRLETGRFKYGTNVRLSNTSVTPYTVDRVLFDILLPDQGSPEFKEAEIGDLLYKPRVQRHIFVWKVGGSTVHQVVTVQGIISFRQRRVLGLLGWRKHVLKIEQTTPVDAQSVALYHEAKNN